MTAHGKQEKPSSETKELDKTLVAGMPCAESVCDVQKHPPTGFGGGGMGGPGGGSIGTAGGRVPVSGVGSSNSGGIGSGTAPSSGGQSGFGSSRGTSNSGGVSVQGGGNLGTSPGNDDLPIRRSNSVQSGSSSPTQPKKPEQSQTRPVTSSTTKPRPTQKPQTSTTNSSSPQSPTLQKNPTPKYSDSVDSISPAKTPQDTINDQARRAVNQQHPRPDFDPHNKPIKRPPPVKITPPKPKEYESIPNIPQQDPFTETIPTVPQRDPFTEAVPSTPQKERFGDQRTKLPNTPNPDKPSRNRRNSRKPDTLKNPLIPAQRIKHSPEFEEFLRKNPLTPAQKPNPSVSPGNITPPSNGGQAVQAKKTPSGGSQNSNSGGNSGQQQPTKKQKKALTKKYTGRDIDKLTAAEEKEFKQGYVISNDNGKKYIKRKSEADDYPQMHLEEVNGKQVIAEGPSPSNRGNSNTSTMKREYKAKFGQDAPQGDDIHHLIPVNVWQEDPIVKALEAKGAAEQKLVAGVDDGDGLISVPSNSNAMEATHQNLEQNGGRVKIAHPSSHTKWDDHVKELSGEEQKKLLKNKKYERLEDVPIEKLEESISNIREQLRKDLQNAAKQLEKGNYNNLPSWIDPKYQLKPDPKKAPPSQKKQYPRLVERPTDKDIAEFRKALTALKAKVGPGKQKHDLYNDRANLNADERQFRTLGYSAMLAVKDNNGHSYSQPFVFQHKGTEVGIYRRGDYTQVATIDLQQGIISVNKPFNSVEDNWLAEQQKVVLAQTKETLKTLTQKSRGFEIG